MGIKLQGVNLGYLGLDYDLLVSGHESLNKGRQQGLTYPRSLYQSLS